MTGRYRSRYDREIAALAVPALAALAADPVVSLVDTAFVGRLGASPLGALGVTSAVFNVAFFLFAFLAYGTTPFVARAIGRGDTDEAGKITVTSLALAVTLGVLTTVAMLLFARPLLQVMGAGSDILSSGLTYLRIRAFAVPAVLLVVASHGIYRGHQDTRTPLFVSVGLNAINLILDPILIFGLDWGIAGAAWATVAAQWAGAAWFLWLIIGKSSDRFGARAARPDLARIVGFLTVGRDLTIRAASLLVTLTVATAVATRIGTEEVAGHQVAIQLWIFLALSVDALAVAGHAMVGKYLGRGAAEEARELSNRLLVLGLVVGVGLALVMALLRPWLPGWFSDDPAVVAQAASVYVFIVVMQPLNALVFVWDGIIIGAADFGYLAVAMVAAGAAGSAVMLAVIPFEWGLAGVWWGIVVLMLTRAATLARWQWSPRAFRLH